MSDQNKEKALKASINTIRKLSQNPDVKKMVGILDSNNDPKRRSKRLARAYFESRIGKKAK